LVLFFIIDNFFRTKYSEIYKLKFFHATIVQKKKKMIELCILFFEIACYNDFSYNHYNYKNN